MYFVIILEYIVVRRAHYKISFSPYRILQNESNRELGTDNKSTKPKPNGGETIKSPCCYLYNHHKWRSFDLVVFAFELIQDFCMQIK